jgi:hypothetical protein
LHDAEAIIIIPLWMKEGKDEGNAIAIAKKSFIFSTSTPTP